MTLKLLQQSRLGVQLAWTRGRRDRETRRKELHLELTIAAPVNCLEVTFKAKRVDEKDRGRHRKPPQNPRQAALRTSGGESHRGGQEGVASEPSMDGRKDGSGLWTLGKRSLPLGGGQSCPSAAARRSLPLVTACGHRLLHGWRAWEGSAWVLLCLSCAQDLAWNTGSFWKEGGDRAGHGWGAGGQLCACTGPQLSAESSHQGWGQLSAEHCPAQGPGPLPAPLGAGQRPSINRNKQSPRQGHQTGVTRLGGDEAVRKPHPSPALLEEGVGTSAQSHLPSAVAWKCLSPGDAGLETWSPEAGGPSEVGLGAY